jgi:hypothetical protein
MVIGGYNLTDYDIICVVYVFPVLDLHSQLVFLTGLRRASSPSNFLYTTLNTVTFQSDFSRPDIHTYLSNFYSDYRGRIDALNGAIHSSSSSQHYFKPSI